MPLYITKRYGNSKQLRYINGQAVIPIGYMQTKAPLYKKREINQYTPKGRELIHKNLESVNIGVLHYLMRNPVQFTSVEFNNNRLALYCAQHGCCAITKAPLVVGAIHCHHKIPKNQGGTDKYDNLVLVSDETHTLIHATSAEIISEYMMRLKLNSKQQAKINKLRQIANLFNI